jgi:hypothetical protein
MALPPGAVSVISKLMDIKSANFAFRMARFPTMFFYALTFSMIATLAIYLGKTFFAVIQPMTSFSLTHVVFFIAVIYYIILVSLFIIMSPMFVLILEIFFPGSITIGMTRI